MKKTFFLLTFLPAMAISSSAQEEDKTVVFEGGGYGDAIFTRQLGHDGSNMYALPHVDGFVDLHFRKGWTVSAEVDFSSGGCDAEGNRACEFSLENFSVEKSFASWANVKAGLMQVPVSGIIQAAMPVDYFGVNMPLGESSLLPDTWLEPGISFWGELGPWRYEAMVMPGLDSSRFTPDGWIHDGADAPLDINSFNTIAMAARVDNSTVEDLRLGLSGYCGGAFDASAGRRHGTVAIGSFDFDWRPLSQRLIVRGGVTYGHQSSSDEASHNMVTTGLEAGYDVLPERLKASLYCFGRYDHISLGGSHTNRYSVGLNYFPVKEVVLKCEYSHTRAFERESEISVAVGFAFNS